MQQPSLQKFGCYIVTTLGKEENPTSICFFLFFFLTIYQRNSKQERTSTRYNGKCSGTTPTPSAPHQQPLSRKCMEKQSMKVSGITTTYVPSTFWIELVPEEDKHTFQGSLTFHRLWRKRRNGAGSVSSSVLELSPFS